MKKITNMSHDVQRLWLRELRLERGYDLRGIAEKVSVTAKFMGDIEHGRRNPSVKLAFKLASILDFPFEKIFLDVKEEGKQKIEA
jgi:putative transcriptional regulator